MLLAISGDAIIAAGAVVGAGLITGPIVWLMARYERRNSSQHADAARHREDQHRLLITLHDKVDHHGELLGNHLSWHAHDNEKPQVAVHVVERAAEA